MQVGKAKQDSHSTPSKESPDENDEKKQTYILTYNP
jgi:hypothetical protein